MNYDFDLITDRRGSGCFKYDALKMLYGRDDLLSMWVADMDFQVAPAIREALQRRLDHGVFGYNLRLPVFYEVVCNWLQRRYGFSIHEDWVLNSPGIVSAINLAILQFSSPGDGVLIQTPVYRPFFDAVQDHGRRLLTNPLVLDNGFYKIDFVDFEQKLKQAKLFILCNPHNPVGRLWTESELLQIGALCRKYRVPVISDEIHADIVYDGKKAISFGALEDFADNAICCFSPAKSFNIAGLGTAVIIVKNPLLREKLGGMLQKLHLYLGNSFGIEGLIAAWRDSDDWLEQLLAYLQDNRDYLSHVIESNFPQLQLVKPQATYLAWMDFRSLGLAADPLTEWLTNTVRLALDPGTKFGEDGAGFSRLNFGCPRSLIEEALLRLRQAIEERS